MLIFGHDFNTMRARKLNSLNEKSCDDVDLLFWSIGIQLHWVYEPMHLVVLIHFEALFSILYLIFSVVVFSCRLCLFQQNVDCLLLAATKVMHFIKWQATNNRHKKMCACVCVSQFHRKFHFNGVKCKLNELKERTHDIAHNNINRLSLRDHKWDNLGTIRKYQFDCWERIKNNNN